MKIDLTIEELNLLLDICIESLFENNPKKGITRPEREEYMDKATKLYNKLERTYEIGCITERDVGQKW